MLLTDLPECKYRRRTRRPGLLKLYCFLKRSEGCTPEQCQVCTQATEETGQRTTIELEGGQAAEGYFYDVPDPNFAAVRSLDSDAPTVGDWLVERPDLQAIATSLPPHRPGKDRHFTLGSDGSIEYAQEDGDWEPPREIKGYRRDPDNSWRFEPLWPVCYRRVPRSYRSESCGCIKVTMKCMNSDSTVYDQDISDSQCQQCPVRVEQKGE